MQSMSENLESGQKSRIAAAYDVEVNGKKQPIVLVKGEETGIYTNAEKSLHIPH